MNLNGKTTNPGELRTSIVLERATLVEGAGGFKKKTFATIATVLARWKNVHGAEVWAAESIQAAQPATVLIRYRADVDVTCAVSRGAERYQIVSMDDIENRHEYIEMKVSRLVNG